MTRNTFIVACLVSLGIAQGALGYPIWVGAVEVLAIFSVVAVAADRRAA